MSKILPFVKPTSDVLGFKDLYESQQRGVDHLYQSDHTQFVAPMGFGKSAVALTAIGELIVDGEIDCALVIAPKRVAQLVWSQEAAKWKHLQGLTIQVVDGGAASRLEKLGNEDADIYVIGIDHTPWLCEYLRTLPDGHPLFNLLVIDELSRLKNPRGVWSKKLRKVAPRFKMRWGLTGTPRPNGLLDQFAPLSVITGDKLWGRSFDRWRNEHFMAVDYQGYDWQPRIDHIARLEADVARYTVTVDVGDLPDVPELVVRDRWVTLPGDVMRTYRDMERDLVAHLDDGHITAANTGVMTIKLAQITQGFLYDETHVAQHVHDTKMTELIEMVEDLDGDPVIIVYEFTEDLERMQAEWPGLFWLGDGVSDARSKLTEHNWNEGKIPILAIHPAAAGHGLNLQRGGNQMIWYGLTWSAELYEQTIARIHRQGQRERCFVHRILARDTIDEAKLLRLDGKLTAQEAFKRHLRRV